MTNTVAVLGNMNEEERTFSNSLKNAFTRSRIVIDVPDATGFTDPVAFLRIHLKRYKDQRLPLIVLLSATLLYNICSTNSKRSMLKDITDWSPKKCLHIWMNNITENEVRSYSSILCRRNANFRRINVHELIMLNPMEMVQTVMNLLNDVTELFSRSNYNLSPQEIKELAEKIKRSTPREDEVSNDDELVTIGQSISEFQMSLGTATSTPILKETFHASGSKKQSVDSKRANRSTSISKNENAYKLVASTGLTVREGISKPSSASAQASASSVGARTNEAASKNKKKKSRSHSSRIADLSYEQYYQISIQLDIGYGANWKQVAAYFEVEDSAIKLIELSAYQRESPTMNLFELLRTRKPLLTLGELIQACKCIGRVDVVHHIEHNVLN